nr:protein kinase family protein [Modestobacter versicolor]
MPDRYRPLDQVAPDEETPTGVIRSWRARDRVLNRDVALRVHTPGGPAAREWITRALTAGGLATPALSMVYDAAEGTGGTEPGGAAYVVNEWIEGTRLSDRLATEGPLPEREARALVRRLAEGVAEAHRVGLAVGGLTPEHVVLRPGGLVGLLSVPAASGTEKGDIAALGALLELCLTGERSDLPGARPTVISSPDLAALVRRARSTDPATGLSNVSTMASLLAERPRPGAGAGTGPQDAVRPDGFTDSGWMRRLRDRRDLVDAEEARRDDPDGEQPVRLDRNTLPPVPGAGLARPLSARPPAPADEDDDLDWGETFAAEDDPADDDGPPTTARRRFAVAGVLVMALALVIAAALWFGNNVLSVAGNVDQDGAGSTPPSGSATTGGPASSSAPAAGAPATIASAGVFDPFGDGEPENDDEVPLTFDGDPTTTWSTLNYRGSADFGNLKPGVGIVYDLGSEQSLAGVTLTTTTPGATVEVRTGGTPDGDLDAFTVATDAELSGTDELTFAEPVSTRYVLVWVTGLVANDDGFGADLAEVTVTAAG